MPRLGQIAVDYAERGLDVLGVTDASAEDVRAFSDAQFIPFPVLAEAAAARRAYGVAWIWGSVVFLVAPDGEVVADELEEALEHMGETGGR